MTASHLSLYMIALQICVVKYLSVLFLFRAPLPESVFMEMSPKTESSCNTMDCWMCKLGYKKDRFKELRAAFKLCFWSIVKREIRLRNKYNKDSARLERLENNRTLNLSHRFAQRLRHTPYFTSPWPLEIRDACCSIGLIKID